MTTPDSQPLASTDVDIETIPWSELGPTFIEKWGRANPKDPQPEHLEIIGTTGSGKSFLLTQILAEMVRRRNSSVIFIATKQADGTVTKMGWPIVDNWREVQKHEQVVFWPRTSLIGSARKAYQAEKIQELLDNLWQPDANTIVVFDEFVYIQGLSRDLQDTLEMYLREGRSHGITCVMGKQRGQGVMRDMHSESNWKVCFKLTDRKDMEYMSELFGNKQEWIPIMQSLNKAKYEFIIQSKIADRQYISYVDKPVNTRLRKKQDRFPGS